MRIFHIRHDNADEKSRRTRNADEKCFHTYLVSSGGGNGWREPGRLKWSSFWFACRLPPLHCSPVVHFHAQPARMYNNFIMIFSDFSSPFPWASRRGWFYACCLFSLLLMRFFFVGIARMSQWQEVHMYARISPLQNSWDKKNIGACLIFSTFTIAHSLPFVFQLFFRSCPFSSTPVTPPTTHSINTHKPPSGRWSGPGFHVKFMRYSMIFSLCYLLCTVNVLGHFLNWMYCMLWSWFGVRHMREFYSLQQSFILAGSIVLPRMDGLLAPAISPVNWRFRYTRITVDYLCLFTFCVQCLCVCVFFCRISLIVWLPLWPFLVVPKLLLRTINGTFSPLCLDLRSGTSLSNPLLRIKPPNRQACKPHLPFFHSFCQNTKHVIAGNELYVCAMALHFNLIKLTQAGTCRQTMGDGIGC